MGFDTQANRNQELLNQPESAQLLEARSAISKALEEWELWAGSMNELPNPEAALQCMEQAIDEVIQIDDEGLYSTIASFEETHDSIFFTCAPTAYENPDGLTRSCKQLLDQCEDDRNLTPEQTYTKLVDHMRTSFTATLFRTKYAEVSGLSREDYLEFALSQPYLSAQNILDAAAAKARQAEFVDKLNQIR